LLPLLLLLPLPLLWHNKAWLASCMQLARLQLCRPAATGSNRMAAALHVLLKALLHLAADLVMIHGDRRQDCL